MKFLLAAGCAVVLFGCGSTTTSTDDSPGAADKTVKTESTKTPDGLSERDFPVPFYPNSKEDDKVPLAIYGHKLPNGHRSLTSSRITSDSIQEVVEFYKGKLTVDSATVTGDSGYVAGKVANGDTVQVMLKREPRGTTIGLAADVSK